MLDESIEWVPLVKVGQQHAEGDAHVLPTPYVPAGELLGA